jgi:hypothetical protein
MITILNREIPNQLEELTIEQFEAITDINNNQELDPIDKHLQVFAYLGIPESLSFGTMMWLILSGWSKNLTLQNAKNIQQ